MLLPDYLLPLARKKAHLHLLPHVTFLISNIFPPFLPSVTRFVPICTTCEAFVTADCNYFYFLRKYTQTHTETSFADFCTCSMIMMIIMFIYKRSPFSNFSLIPVCNFAEIYRTVLANYCKCTQTHKNLFCTLLYVYHDHDDYHVYSNGHHVQILP